MMNDRIVARLKHAKNVRGEIYADCPFCGKPSTEMKFRFNPEKGLFKCYSGKCGKQGSASTLARHLGIEREQRKKKGSAPEWVYKDEKGQPLYGVTRYVRGAKKTYAQFHYRPSAQGGEWVPGLNGAARTIYNLPEVLKADTVFVVEGEKCAEALRSLGLVATTNSGGAGKWDPRFAQHLKGKTVYILPDNDAPGADHAEKVFSSLFRIAHVAKIVSLPELPEKGDVADWIARGGKPDQLVKLCEASGDNNAPKDLLHMEAARSKRLTDTGNAEQFTARNQEIVRFCHSWDDWLLWDGLRWKRDRAGLVGHLAKETVDEIWNEARQFEGDGYAKALKRWAQISRSHGKLGAMLSLARNEKSVSVTHEIFDTHKQFLNVENGTLDLNAGTLLAHDPERYLTRLAPVRFDAEAKAPAWDRFVRRIFAENEELIGYVQKAAGYSLTGYTHEQCFFFCYGTGLNGKSTFVETLLFLIGEYGEKTSISTLMAKENDGGDANPALVALQAARMVVSSEIEEGKRWNESLVKDLSGSDRISARPLYGRPITFFPEFKLWVYGNHKPSIRGTDRGIRRRIKLLPFTVTIPPHEKDERLGDKLRAELPGILNWCLEGWKRAQREGMKTPPVVEAATDTYFAEQDTLQGFIEDALRVHFVPGSDLHDSNMRLKNADLYRAYIEYNEERRQFPLSHRTFTQRMIEKGFAQHADGNGRPWLGLSIRQGGGGL